MIEIILLCLVLAGIAYLHFDLIRIAKNQLMQVRQAQRETDTIIRELRRPRTETTFKGKA